MGTDTFNPNTFLKSSETQSNELADRSGALTPIEEETTNSAKNGKKPISDFMPDLTRSESL